MTSTVDTSAALAPAVARFDRQHADARQQRWMAELEQAMLAQQAPLQQQRQGEQPLPSADGEGQQAVQGAADAAPARAGTGPAGVARAGAHAAAQPASQPRSDSASPPAQAGGSAQADGAAQAAPRAAADARPAAEEALSGGAARPGAGFVATPVTGQVGAISAQMALAAGAAASGAAAAEAAEPAPAPRANEVLGVARSAFPGFAATEGEQAATENGEAAATGLEAGDAPGEEYEKQLLHLFHGEDGVHAYIRDAELTGARLRAVAQALAVELSGSGSRLNGLTVNGRRVSMGGTGTYDEERPETASEAAPLPVIQKGTI